MDNESIFLLDHFQLVFKLRVLIKNELILVFLKNIFQLFLLESEGQLTINPNQIIFQLLNY